MKFIDDILCFFCDCIIAVIMIMNTVLFGAAVYVCTNAYFAW